MPEIQDKLKVEMSMTWSVACRIDLIWGVAGVNSSQKHLNSYNFQIIIY